jgi:hypothetical protein
MSKQNYFFKLLDIKSEINYINNMKETINWNGLSLSCELEHMDGDRTNHKI